MTAETKIDTGTDELLCAIRDRVAVITLNRPEVRNALSDNLTPALRSMIKSCGENPEVGALLITGAGTAFCAGGNVKGMGAHRDPKRLAMSYEEKVADLQERQRLLTGALVSVRKPTIAALPGPAVGAGLAIAISAFGGFVVAQQAVKRMLPNKHGAILFTGASASVKGYPQSAPFAMGKFALRGLAQSMARELSPQGIHVAHFVIDGGIRSAVRAEAPERPDSMLDPDAIALSYWNVLQQPRSAWSWELELRPWVEKF